MDAAYWHQRWENSDISFHEAESNIGLVRHFEKLAVAEGSRVFVPLCGKTLDIAWLLSTGYRVVGVELSELAIEQLFAELGLMPKVTETGKFRKFSAKNIDIFVGDIFDVSKSTLGPVAAVYDRAALVALPEETRRRYAAHLVEITTNAPQLLITFVYDQSLMEAPPFSLSAAEVDEHYGNSYTTTFIECADIPGGLKGICPARTQVWLLKNRP